MEKKKKTAGRRTNDPVVIKKVHTLVRKLGKAEVGEYCGNKKIRTIDEGIKNYTKQYIKRNSYNYAAISEDMCNSGGTFLYPTIKY